MALPEAPGHVTALAASFWSEALAAARAEAEVALAGERGQLAEQRAVLETAREHNEQLRTEQAAELTRGREEWAALAMQLKALEDQRLGWESERERLLNELQRNMATAEQDRQALAETRITLAEVQQRAGAEGP